MPYSPFASGTNPIIPMDFPDPDILRVGDAYYMVSTTMYFMPGCVILRSHDLIHWEFYTHVYDMLENTPAQRRAWPGLKKFVAGLRGFEMRGMLRGKGIKAASALRGASVHG